jgi:ATP-dependent HslUV protease ATP-binding subunit HslU
MKTENVELQFTDDGIETLADISTHINSTIENIGARRLHTIIEKVLEEISFTAPDKSGEKVIVDKQFVEKNIGNIIKDKDLSKFIL